MVVATVAVVEGVDAESGDGHVDYGLKMGKKRVMVLAEELEFSTFIYDQEEIKGVIFLDIPFFGFYEFLCLCCGVDFFVFVWKILLNMLKGTPNC